MLLFKVLSLVLRIAFRSHQPVLCAGTLFINDIWIFVIDAPFFQVSLILFDQLLQVVNRM